MYEESKTSTGSLDQEKLGEKHIAYIYVWKSYDKYHIMVSKTVAYDNNSTMISYTHCSKDRFTYGSH